LGTRIKIMRLFFVARTHLKLLMVIGVTYTICEKLRKIVYKVRTPHLLHLAFYLMWHSDWCAV
jgi:hypothetical protein